MWCGRSVALKSFERTNLDESGEPFVETVEIRVPMGSGSDTDSEN